MKAYSIIPFAFVALTACTGGTQQKGEEVAGNDNAAASAEVAQTVGAIDLAKVKTLWKEQVLKMSPSGKGTLPNKKALYDIDGDGCDEVFFSEQQPNLGIGYIAVFTNSKEGLEFVDLSCLDWQTTDFAIYPKGFVYTSCGSENPEEGSGWARYSKLVNSKVEEVYYEQEEYKEDEIVKWECALQKKGQADKSVTKEEFKKAVPLEGVERVCLSDLKWEDVSF